MESTEISPPVSPVASFRSVEFSPNTSFGSTNMSTDASLGYDFEDSETRAQLELIDDLQKLGVSDHIGLPQVSSSPFLESTILTRQLVVVGDQSTGKSSVLQAVTEIPFPINDEMCTRFATEIVLQRTTSDKGTTVKFEIIPSSDESSDRQKALRDWHPKGVDSNAELNKLTMESVFLQVSSSMFQFPFGTFNDGLLRLKR
jgi:hypothetical protein